jgi:hypothetical protein
MEHQTLPRRQPLLPYGHFAKPPGSLVKVRDCPNGYPLPHGLNPGDTVRIVGFDYGYYTVEKDAQSFEIFLVNIADSALPVAEPVPRPKPERLPAPKK